MGSIPNDITMRNVFENIKSRRTLIPNLNANETQKAFERFRLAAKFGKKNVSIDNINENEIVTNNSDNDNNNNNNNSNNSNNNNVKDNKEDNESEVGNKVVWAGHLKR